MAEWRAPLAAKEKDDESGIRKRQKRNEGGISEKIWEAVNREKLHEQKEEGLEYEDMWYKIRESVPEKKEI